MSRPKNFHYTDQHEWVNPEKSLLRVGITDFAQSELGDIVFVDLPEIGKQVKAGEAFMTVESVKAVSEIYAPLDGIIKEANQQLSTNPELVNSDPFGQGWMVELEGNNQDLNKLMTADAYEKYLSEPGH